jgi:hypothetical protein
MGNFGKVEDAVCGGRNHGFQDFADFTDFFGIGKRVRGSEPPVEKKNKNKSMKKSPRTRG